MKQVARLTEPKYKLGDDGELEEIIDDSDEKPKRKRKPKLCNRTLYIPLSLMLVLVTAVVLLLLIVFWVTRPAQQIPIIAAYPTNQPRPSETPGGYLDQVAPCGLLPVTQKPRFAFSVSPSGGDSELLRIDADGTNSCRLTNNNIYDNQPAWSPDGKRIAFTAFFAATGYNSEDAIYIMDANGENLFTLTKGLSNLALPAWSPDAKQIAFQGTLKGSANSSDIFIINPDGTNLINLTSSPSVDSGPNWSPDGKSIVFASDRTYQQGVAGGVSQPDSYEIYVMDANGDNVRQLTSNKQIDAFPKWSPDGQWIVFQKEDNIYLMDKEGKRTRRLTNDPNGAYTPFWMPDGNEVGFTTDRNAIQFVNIQTGQTRSLRTVGNPSFVAPWSPPT